MDQPVKRNRTSGMDRQINAMVEKNKTIPPCGKCGTNRWRTVIAGEGYQCRNCGDLREV